MRPFGARRRARAATNEQEVASEASSFAPISEGSSGFSLVVQAENGTSYERAETELHHKDIKNKRTKSANCSLADASGASESQHQAAEQHKKPTLIVLEPETPRKSQKRNHRGIAGFLRKLSPGARSSKLLREKSPPREEAGRKAVAGPCLSEDELGPDDPPPPIAFVEIDKWGGEVCCHHSQSSFTTCDLTESTACSTFVPSSVASSLTSIHPTSEVASSSPRNNASRTSKSRSTSYKMEALREESKVPAVVVPPEDAPTSADLDFRLAEEVNNSWYAVRGLKNYEELLGGQVVFNMMEISPSSRTLLGLDAFRADAFAKLCKKVVAMIESIVILLGPDLDLLKEVKDLFEKRGFAPKLFPFFAKSVMPSIKEVLKEEFTEEMEDAWEKFFRYIVVVNTRKARM